MENLGYRIASSWLFRLYRMMARLGVERNTVLNVPKSLKKIREIYKKSINDRVEER